MEKNQMNKNSDPNNINSSRENDYPLENDRTEVPGIGDDNVTESDDITMDNSDSEEEEEYEEEEEEEEDDELVIENEKDLEEPVFDNEEEVIEGDSDATSVVNGERNKITNK